MGLLAQEGLGQLLVLVIMLLILFGSWVVNAIRGLGNQGGAFEVEEATEEELAALARGESLPDRAREGERAHSGVPRAAPQRGATERASVQEASSKRGRGAGSRGRSAHRVSTSQRRAEQAERFRRRIEERAARRRRASVRRTHRRRGGNDPAGPSRQAEQARTASGAESPAAQLFAKPHGLRRAVIAKEILDQPAGLR